MLIAMQEFLLRINTVQCAPKVGLGGNRANEKHLVYR